MSKLKAKYIPWSLVVLLAALVGAVACDPPPIEPVLNEQRAPLPSGIIEGTVFYKGQKPLCERDPETGEVTKIRGRVLLTMFEYDNPPPPAGGATGAENLLVISASRLFRPGDCMPENAGPGDNELIVRSDAFRWPELDTGLDGRSYQIRGFFDRDERFLPFYGIRNQPGRGDVGGGAFVDTDAVPLVHAKMAFEGRKAQPLGELIRGVTVTLGAEISTERPMFRLRDGTKPIKSSQVIPIGSNQLESERMIYDLADAGLVSLASEDFDYRETFQAAGLNVSLHPNSLAFYMRPYDATGNGDAEPHPIMGGLGIKWMTPLVIMMRARTQAEVAAGIPNVMMVPSVRPSQTAIGDFILKSVFWPEIDIIIPPVAAVDLDPSYRGQCRVPYFAPGNTANLYESAPSHCHYLPSGNYNVNVFSGLVGGELVESTKSDTGLDIEGAGLSHQAWSIPNDLGPPDTRYNPAAVAQIDEEYLLDHQGPEGRFVVYEDDPDADPQEGCGRAVDPDTLEVRNVSPPAIPAKCCAAVQHLCGLELCPVVGTGENAVRELTSLDENGRPSCVPFGIPPICCQDRD